MGIIDNIKKNKAIKEYVYDKKDVKKDFISTGGLTLNVLFSGRFNGGIPVGKISQMAAPSSLGKSFIGMKLAKNAHKKDKDWIVIYVDSESAFDYDFAESVGVDIERLLVIQSNQIEVVQQQIMAITSELTKEEKSKVLLVIDSWGGLVTSKSVENAESGHDAVDFTPAKKKNMLARLMTGMGMTIFVINQIYECVTADTLIQTELGEKPISDLVVGEKVLTINGYEEIHNTFSYDDAYVYEIEFENGDIIEATEGHKFVIEDEHEKDGFRWIEVGKLLPDTDLVNLDTLGKNIPKQV